MEFELLNEAQPSGLEKARKQGILNSIIYNQYSVKELI